MLYSQHQPSDDQVKSQSRLSISPNQKVRMLDQEEIFRLIDSTLYFEACLYHQVLPISVEGNRLKLGMVNPEDSAAIDYVGRILSYMKYSLVPQPLAAEEHKLILSTYLNRPGKNKSTTKAPITKSPQIKATGLNPNEQPTYILVEREEIASIKAEAKPQKPSPTPSALSVPPAKEIEQTAHIAQSLPTLSVRPSHLSSSLEQLKTLPPKQLLQELMGRVLEKGIGRLYFEQKSPQRGRIVCSQDGNLQCVLPDIPTTSFQAIIQEMKQLTHMPLEPVQESRQVEIERFYQNERLLLRLRVMPGAHGEQATLQVLRGAALDFYQQQQLTNLSRDAIAIAGQLQQKLHQLRERVNITAGSHSHQRESLLAMTNLLESVEQQLEQLKNLPS